MSESDWGEERARTERGLESALRARGMRLRRLNPRHASLAAALPAGHSRTQFYELMRHYSFRLFLRDLIAARAHPEVHRGARSSTLATLCRFCSPESQEQYLTALRDLRLVGTQGALENDLVPEVKDFGGTLQWFIAELMSREFCCSAAAGVVVDDYREAREFDVLASAEGWLLAVEVKSSPPKHIEASELAAVTESFEFLIPDVAFLLVDTHLRMTDKLIPLLEEIFRGRVVSRERRVGEDGLAGEGAGGADGERLELRFPGPLRPQRLRDEVYRLVPGLYLLNSRPTVETNLALCLRTERRWRAGRGMTSPWVTC